MHTKAGTPSHIILTLLNTRCTWFWSAIYCIMITEWSVRVTTSSSGQILNPELEPAQKVEIQWIKQACMQSDYKAIILNQSLIWYIRSHCTCVHGYITYLRLWSTWWQSVKFQLALYLTQLLLFSSHTGLQHQGPWWYNSMLWYLYIQEWQYHPNRQWNCDTNNIYVPTGGIMCSALAQWSSFQ